MSDLSSMMGNMGTIITVMVAVPFVIVMLVFLYLGIRSRGKVSASKDWQSVSGKVLFSGVDMRRSSNGSGGRSTSYYPQVLYTYRVDGQDLQSNAIQFGSQVGYGWAGKAQQIANQYPQGAIVTVYYNPQDPTEAVLERKSTSGGLFIVVGIIIFVILAITVAMSAGSMFFAQGMIDAFSK